MPFVLFHKKVLKPVDICHICDYTNKVAAGYRGRLWGLSSAGRASALQAEGHRFEPCRPHITEYGGVAQLARACGSYPQCRGFKSPSRYEENGSCRNFRFFVRYSLQAAAGGGAYRLSAEGPDVPARIRPRCARPVDSCESRRTFAGQRTSKRLCREMCAARIAAGCACTDPGAIFPNEIPVPLILYFVYHSL